MNEASGVIQLRRRVRPIRVGFELDISDSQLVQEAIEVATTQWGGMLFPLLPNFVRRPAWWSDYLHPPPPATEIRDGYAAAFEPDYRIALPPVKGRARTYRSISFADLTTESDEWSRIVSGLPASAVYRNLWERDPRFLEREAATAITTPATDSGMGLFVFASFGAFPTKGDLAQIADQYRRTFDPLERDLTPELLLDGFRPTARSPCFGPLQIGSYGLRFRGDPVTAGTMLMLLDPRRVSDVVDFWNLRALGRQVVPIPLGWVEGLIPELVDRLAARGSDRWGGHAEVIGAQRVPDEEVAALTASLKAGGIEVLHSHYPVFWRRRDLRATRWEVVADEDETEVAARDGRVRVGLLAPQVAEYYPGGIARWMSIVDPVPWALPADGSVASMLPAALCELTKLIGAFTHLDVRATDEGIAVPSGTVNDALDWIPPSGRDVLTELLQVTGKGKPTPSQPGLVAEELIRRLGGLHALGLVRDRELINLFERAAVADVDLDSDEAPWSRRRRPRTGLIPRKTLEALLKRRQKNDGERARRHLHALVDRGVLTSGPRLVCPNCTHRNWYPVRELDEEVTCARCLRTYAFPHAEPPSPGDWAYRPIGAFSFPDYAAGSYTVAFALAFLTRSIRERAVWSTNLHLDDALEIDFAVLRESHDRLTEGDSPVLLLGEAKTDGRFDRKDFHRLRWIRRLFPEAILVVATFRSALTRDERKALKEIAQPDVKRRSQVCWGPSMMVLTAVELLSGRDAPDCWTHAGGRAAEIASQNATVANYSEVRRLADLTAQIHLRLPAQHEWARRASRRLARR